MIVSDTAPNAGNTSMKFHVSCLCVWTVGFGPNSQSKNNLFILLKKILIAVKSLVALNLLLD